MPRVCDAPHYLHPNHKTAMPRHVIYLDTETRPEQVAPNRTLHHFRLGWALYLHREAGQTPETGEWCSFDRIEQFWEWLALHLVPKRVLYLIAHNVRFDLIVLQTFLKLPQYGWRLSFFYDADRTQVFEFRAEDYCIRCLSSTNFLPGSLAELAPLVDMVKGAPDFDTAAAEELSAYCRNDVLILARAMEQYMRFLLDNDLGLFRNTLAAQSFGAFRHRWLRHKVFIHRYDRAIQLEEAAYRGARCEVFRVGRYTGQTYTQLDVNSMYVSIMATQSLPVALSRIEEAMSLDRLRMALKHQGVIADVTVQVDEPVYPVVRERANVYPVGTFRTVLTTPEIQLALDRGWVREVHAACVYKMRPILQEYAQWTWEQRCAARSSGNRLYAQLFKDFGNSVFGKFGQRDYWDEVIGECEPDDISTEHVVNLKTGEQYLLHHICGQIHRIRKAGLGYNALLAVCAHVTAHGRLLLWSIIKQAGRDHVIYCDTDSVILDPKGLANLGDWVDPQRLGALKIQGQTSDIEIRARKDYSLGSHAVIAGLPRGAVHNDDDSYLCNIWPCLATYIRAPRHDAYSTYQVTQKRARAIYDGHVDAAGTVTPFEICPEIA